MKIHATRKLFQAGILPHPPATQDVGALAEKLCALRLMFAAEHLIELVTRSVPTRYKMRVGDFCTTIFYGQADANARHCHDSRRNLLSLLQL